MAKKKIMLFIVEGGTEETSLYTVLSRIFSSDTVKFHIVHGDILTKDFPTSNKIVAAVNEQIKAFRGTIYRTTDFCKIVHLTDMDGVFISDDDVIESNDMLEDEPPKYTLEHIYSSNPEGIKRRNQYKRANINRLSTLGKISGIPYSLYYFSSNLDHVLHDKINLSDMEKIALAEEFDMQYADSPNEFIHFMKQSSFSVKGTYHDTWAFIKAERHSLERYSNFGTFLPDKCNWQKK